jgi:hypothetical protein
VVTNAGAFGSIVSMQASRHQLEGVTLPAQTLLAICMMVMSDDLHKVVQWLPKARHISLFHKSQGCQSVFTVPASVPKVLAPTCWTFRRSTQIKVQGPHARAT